MRNVRMKEKTKERYQMVKVMRKSMREKIKRKNLRIKRTSLSLRVKRKSQREKIKRRGRKGRIKNKSLREKIMKKSQKVRVWIMHLVKMRFSLLRMNLLNNLIFHKISLTRKKFLLKKNQSLNLTTQ